MLGFAQNWLPTGNGTNNGFNGGVALQTYNGKLIAGGAFNQAGTVNARGVAMWDGAEWSIVDSTMNDFFAIRPLVIFRDQLYGFVSRNGGPEGYMIRLDSSFRWHEVPNSYCYLGASSGFVHSAAVYDNELYVAGYFDSIGGIPANHIAKWDGITWRTVGTGIDHTDILSMVEYGNELYVGGNFDLAGGVPVHNLARWNGSIWKDVGGGTDGRVFAMEIYYNELYIGGNFEFAGGNYSPSLAKWNGITLSAVGGGQGPTGSTGALIVYGNRLVFGGYFNAGLFQNDAGTWDGMNFDSLGTGLNAGPTDFEIYQDRLYAGGRFHGNGGPNGVAILDTTGFTVTLPEMDLPDFSMSIHPNPLTTQTTISFDKAQKNTVIRIADILGHEIYSTNFSGKTLVIDRAGMAAGIYFLQILEDTTKQQKKPNTGKSKKIRRINHITTLSIKQYTSLIFHTNFLTISSRPSSRTPIPPPSPRRLQPLTPSPPREEPTPPIPPRPWEATRHALAAKPNRRSQRRKQRKH